MAARFRSVWRRGSIGAFTFYPQLILCRGLPPPSEFCRAHSKTGDGPNGTVSSLSILATQLASASELHVGPHVEDSADRVIVSTVVS